jgi:hypothetical protein
MRGRFTGTLSRVKLQWRPPRGSRQVCPAGGGVTHRDGAPRLLLLRSQRDGLLSRTLVGHVGAEE